MLLSEHFFINFNGSIGASDPFVLDVHVTAFPSFRSFSIDFSFDSLFIQEPVDSNLIKARGISFLLDTRIVNVSDIRASVEERGLNGCGDLLALFSVVETFVFVSIVDLV